GIADTVPGGEEERWSFVAAEQPSEPVTGSLRAEPGLDFPGCTLRLRLRLRPLGQRCGQLAGAQVTHHVIGVGWGEEGGAARPGKRRFRGDDASRVATEILRIVEPDPSNGIHNVELLLKRVGNRLGVADNQEIIRQLVRIRLVVDRSLVEAEELFLVEPFLIAELILADLEEPAGLGRTLL